METEKWGDVCSGRPNTVPQSHKMLQEKFRNEFTSQPAWKEMKAAKCSRVHFLPTELFLYLPGPDYPKAFRHLKNLLYPEK